MKNRRLNVLFIAIIALAAMPQAMHDAHRLVNAAQERAESEFWSIFLSYGSAEAGEAKTAGKTELLAARSRRESLEACPNEPAVVRQPEASRDFAQTRPRAKAEARRTPPQEKSGGPETVEVDMDGSDEVVANVFTVRPVVFSEKEQKALRAAGVHARDAERIAGAASRTSVASFAPTKEMQLKKVSDMDKLLRQRTRNLKERNEPLYEIQTPNTIGSM